MNSNCFPPNFIPLRGDCQTYTTQSSGLYINDVPGLSFKLLAQLSDVEQQTASDLYQVSHAEGIKRVIRDLTMGLSGDYNYKNVLDSGRFGRLASTYGAAGFVKMGKQITKLNCWDRFQCTYIEYIEFNADQAYTDFVFEIFDGCDTITYTQDLVCGYNRIQIDYEVKSETAQLVYDTSLALLPDELQCWDTGRGCVCGGGCGLATDVRGFRIDDVQNVDGQWVETSTQNGMTIAASTRCSTYELPCIFKQELAAAIRYAIAIDIMRRAQFSDRNTTLIRNKKETLGEAIVLLDGGKSDITGFSYKGEYHKEMKNVITQAKSFLASQVNNTKCLYCSGRRVEQILP